MRDDNYEPNRVFGMPVGRNPHGRQGAEPQRVMGFPTDMSGPVDPRLISLTHPIRAYRKWRHRQTPDAPEDTSAE